MQTYDHASLERAKAFFAKLDLDPILVPIIFDETRTPLGVFSFTNVFRPGIFGMRTTVLEIALQERQDPTEFCLNVARKLCALAQDLEELSCMLLKTHVSNNAADYARDNILSNLVTKMQHYYRELPPAKQFEQIIVECQEILVITALYLL